VEKISTKAIVEITAFKKHYCRQLLLAWGNSLRRDEKLCSTTQKTWPRIAAEKLLAAEMFDLGNCLYVVALKQQKSF
jgi:hypothetical protein